MKKIEAFNLLHSSVGDLLIGDKNAAHSLVRSLKLLDFGEDIDLKGIDDLTDSVAIAVGIEIEKIINNEKVEISKELFSKLSNLYDTLLQRRQEVTKHKVIRVFISSPGDVGEERNLALKVIENLAYKPLFRDQVVFEAVAWDKPNDATPMLATLTPQEAINLGLPKPSDCDIVISIFWSRMGTPLSDEYRKPEKYQFVNNSKWENWRYLSGTEWEYLDAVKQSEKTGKPMVVVYRRMQEPVVSLRDPDRDEKIAQYELVDTFFRNFTDDSGVILRGVNYYQTPTEFQNQLDLHLQDLVTRILFEQSTATKVSTSEVPILLWQGSPFPGLRSFGVEDSPIFVGRDVETDDLLEKLRSQQFIAVVGASGSGKSSLVKAGLIPRLKNNAIPGSQDWLIFHFSPDALGQGDPFNSLALMLSKENPHFPITAEELRKDSDSLSNYCDSILANGPDWKKCLFLIDQFEEFFTRISLSDFKRFMQLILSALESGKTRFILTLRSDFYHQVLEHSHLASLIKNGTFLLYSPKRDALREMIEKPAERAGLRFEQGLVKRILDDTEEEPGGLALMAFALQQLYDQRENGILTNEAYDQSGGVRGSVGQHAQAAFDALDDYVKATFPMVFRELVEVNPDGTPTRRRVEMERLLKVPACGILINSLAEKRLLVLEKNEKNIPTVEVAHEALFSSWPYLRNWISAFADDLSFGSQIEQKSIEWDESGREKDYLLHGTQLQHAIEWRDRAYANALANDQQIQYISHSLLEQERQKTSEIIRQKREVRRLWGFVIALSILTIAAVGMTILSTLNGQRAVIAENSAKSILLATQAKLEFNSENRTLSMLLSKEALEKYPYQVQAENALNNSIYSGPLPILTLSGHEDTVDTAVWSPDATRIASASWDKSAIIWDAVTGKKIAVLDDQDGNFVRTLSWSPDGKQLATGADMGLCQIWNAKSGKKIQTIEGPEGIIWDVLWSPEGSYIVTASDAGVLISDPTTGKLVDSLGSGTRHSFQWSSDGTQLAYFTGSTLRIWDTSAKDITLEIVAHKALITSVSWSLDGKYLLTSSDDSTAKIWESNTGKLIKTLQGHGGVVNDASWSPDSNRVVTVSEDHTARVWDARSGLTIYTLEGLDNNWTSVEWSTNGEFLLTLAWDNQFGLSSAKDGKLLATFTGHEAPIRTASFSPESNKILTASNDKTVRIWTTTDFLSTILYPGHAGVITTISFSPNREEFVTASADKTARIWSLESGEELRVLPGHQAIVNQALWSPDGTRILTLSSDKTARIWNSQTGSLNIELKSADSGEFINGTWSPDGSRVITVDKEGQAIIWSSTAGTRLLTFKPELGEEGAIAWSSDGNLLLTDYALYDSKAGQVTVEAPIPVSSLDTYDIESKWSPDQNLILSSNRKGIWIWDPKDATVQLQYLDLPAYLNKVEWSPDGKNIVASFQNSAVVIWDSQTGEEVLQLKNQDEDLWEASWSPVGNQLLVIETRGNATIWDAETGDFVQGFDLGKLYTRRTGWSPDGSVVWTVSDDEIMRIWDTQSGVLLYQLNQSEESTKSVYWSHNGKVCLILTDGKPELWDISTGTRLNTPIHDLNNPIQIEFSPSDDRILTVNDNRTVQLWDYETGNLIGEINDHSIEYAEWSPDGKRIITRSLNESVNIFDSATVTQIPSTETESILIGKEIAPDKTGILSIRDTTIEILDPEKGSIDQRLVGHTKKILGAFWSPDSTKILSFSDDKTARIWDVKKGKEITIFRGFDKEILSASWSSAGNRIVIAYDNNTAKVFDVSTGSELISFSNTGFNIDKALYSPYSEYILFLSRSETPHFIKVWEDWRDTLKHIDDCCLRPLTADEKQMYGIP